ncbi:energy transducer TonB [Sphingomonas sp.]|uniref:energy transducer TonB n=1 Tax=Sphingomonas sp. TaxID=28214 RepID=UPI003D6D9701
MKSGLLLAMMGLAAQAAQTVDAPLPPSGNWTVEYQDNLCTISRKFGGTEQGITLGFQPIPLSGAMLAVLMTPVGPGDKSRSGKLTMTLSPSGATIPASFDTVVTRDRKQQITRFAIRRAQLPSVETAESIAFSLSKGSSFSIAPTRMAAAMTALSTCEKDLLRNWGYDLTTLASVVTPAEPLTPFASWVSSIGTASDSEGQAVMRWLINTKGRAQDCVIVSSSKNADFDRTACALVVKNARYRPALDKDGKPVATPGYDRLTLLTDR